MTFKTSPRFPSSSSVLSFLQSQALPLQRGPQVPCVEPGGSSGHPVRRDRETRVPKRSPADAVQGQQRPGDIRPPSLPGGENRNTHTQKHTHTETHTQKHTLPSSIDTDISTARSHTVSPLALSQSPSNSRVYLSGYGVELAIKNQEYKAKDDTQVQGTHTHLPTHTHTHTKTYTVN